jgi:2-iminobutanoate/2-iminopropanoate deaminase
MKLWTLQYHTHGNNFKRKGEKIMKKIISTDKAPAAIGAYSQATALQGLVFTSGQLPLDPATGTIVNGDIQAQAKQALANVKAIIEGAGLTLDDVLKVSVFLTDIADFTKVNEVYQAVFSENCPARSCFQVSALPKGAAIEIEAIAGK